MRKSLEALLSRKTFKASKLRTLLGLTATRLLVLKNQRNVRCSYARSDIAQAISLGRRDRALDRAEYVVREQRMLDLFVAVESYCKFLSDRASLLESTKVCPQELREAIASLMYVSSKSGELPELQDVRSMFSSKFGSDFPSAAVDVRNGCDVSPKIIHLASIDEISLESKLKVVKEVAAEKGIPFDLDKDKASSSDTISNIVQEEEVVAIKTRPRPSHGGLSGPSEYHWKKSLSEPVRTNTEFRDAAAAAQTAFEYAANAAVAARAAADLSRSQSHGKCSGVHSPMFSEDSGHGKVHHAETEASTSETDQVVVTGNREARMTWKKEIPLHAGLNWYGKERTAKPRNGRQHRGQINEDLESEDDDDMIVEEAGCSSRYRRRTPAYSDENPSDDDLREEMGKRGSSSAEENGHFNTYADDSPSNAASHGTPFTHWSAGQSSLSVRSRYGRDPTAKGT